MFREYGGKHLCAKTLNLNPFGEDWILLIRVFALPFGQDTSLPHCDSPGLLPPQMPLSYCLCVMCRLDLCRLERDQLITYLKSFCPECFQIGLIHYNSSWPFCSIIAFSLLICRFENDNVHYKTLFNIP